MPLKQQKNAGNARKMLLMLAFFFKNPLSVKNAFLMPAQLPDAYPRGTAYASFIRYEVPGVASLTDNSEYV